MSDSMIKLCRVDPRWTLLVSYDKRVVAAYDAHDYQVYLLWIGEGSGIDPDPAIPQHVFDHFMKHADSANIDGDLWK